MYFFPCSGSVQDPFRMQPTNVYILSNALYLEGDKLSLTTIDNSKTA